MNAIPIYDATAPIACTASSEEIATRVEQIERMRAHLERIDRTPDGLLLRFPAGPGVEAELRQFAIDEKGCCQFWGFAIETAEGQLTLRWDGPPDTADFMDRLHEFFVGDEPLTATSGLL
jgi:hypothetical protein